MRAVSDQRAASGSFTVFDPFPELRVGVFAKRDDCRSDREAAQQLGFTKVAYTNQVHGTTVLAVREPSHGVHRGDGLITDRPGLAICVRWADCQNFVVYEPKESIIGVLHAGWRGLAKGVITSFFETLTRGFGVEPKDTYVGAGPSLCKGCATFSDPTAELPPHFRPFTTGQNVDLQAAAEVELLSLGVPHERIERHPDCTACQPDRYWTSRGGDREEVQRGRARNYLVAGILEQ